jgi:NOL1/NOP2/fmu family ribosome biogenesis protein
MEESPCAEVLSSAFDKSSYPIADLSYAQAIAYLRREAIVLPPDVPRGIVVVSYQGHPLGTVKNIGSRANNLYPREWAIRSTHVPLPPQNSQTA